MKELTNTQTEVYNFIVDCINADGYPPTRQEIADNFGFNSPNAAQCHLVALEKKGAVRLGKIKSRAIELL